MRTLLLSLAVVTALLAVPAMADEAWQLTELDVLTIDEAPVPPLADGRLGEMGWTDAREYTVVDPESSLAHLKMMFAHRDGILYAGFEARGTTDEIRAEARDRDSDEIWEDDVIEIILAPGPGTREGKRLAVTAGGVVYDALLTHGGENVVAGWDCDIEAGANIRSSRWTAEFAIPLADLGLGGEKGELLGLNVVLHRSDGNDLRLCTVAGECPLGGLSLAGFAVKGLDTDQMRFELTDATMGDDGISFDIAARNRLHQAEQFTMRVKLHGSDGTSASDTFVLTVDDHETARFERGPYGIGDGEACLIVVEVEKRNRERARQDMGLVAFIASPAE